jgi:outer membrane biosynthesis protein TonB
MTLDDMVINDNWVLKGCGGWWSQPTELTAGHSYRLDAWFYEYGGGACNQLLFIDQQTWGIVPAAWLSQNKQAEVVKTKDPALLAILESSKTIYDNTLNDYEAAQLSLSNATTKLNTLRDSQTQNAVTIDIAQQNVTTSEQAVINAQQELEAIPPFREPAPTPEETQKPIEEPTEVIIDQIPEPVTPTPTEEPTVANVSEINPQELTTAQAEELKTEAVAILETSEQGSPEYEQALEALFVVAQADDIVLSEELAAIPGAEALIGAINFMGNVGADMSPKVREESKKVVVTAVVAVGAAVNAATGAALTAAAPSAAASASAGGSGGTSSRRRND